MGVLDRIRRRARSHDPAAPDIDAQTTSGDTAAESAPEMRGDFMLLPPLRPTFGTPARFQHSLDDYLVTHRPTSVTNEPLAHEIEPERMGVVRAAARRSRRPRPARDPLVHRRDVDDLDYDEPAEQLPAPIAPRRLAATKSAPAPRVPAGELPSPSSVRMSVSAPSIRVRAAEPENAEEDLAAVLEASRSENSTDAPVMRRRGGAALPETAAPIPPTGPTLMEDVADLDLDALEAPKAADIPPLTGGTRVRGAQPPAPSAPTRPLLGSTAAEPASSPAPAETGPAPAELVHRSDEAPASAPESERTARTAGTTTPTAAAADGTSVASMPVAELAPQVTAGPRESRSLLGSRPSMAAPKSGSAESESKGSGTKGASASTAKPGAAGRTGVQRKARTSPEQAQPVAPVARAAQESAFTASSAGTRPDPAGGATASPTSARATATPGTPDAPAPLEARGTVPPSLQPRGDAPTTPAAADAPAPRTIDVPAEVRSAVAAATGQAPDSVTVHQGDHVHAETAALNAQAFTRDGEIFLSADADLDTPRGQALLAHELTHVAQQRGGTERMPDESTREGVAHEQAAQRVERAIASGSKPGEPGALDHSRAGAPSGGEPVNVPEGVQRASLNQAHNAMPMASINRKQDDDDDQGIGLPHQPEPAIAHASVLKPSLLEQVDLIHAGHPTPVREEEFGMPGAGESMGRRGAMRAGSAGSGAQQLSVSRAGGGSSAGSSGPSAGSSGSSGSGESGGGAGGDVDSTGESPRPEPSTKEKAFDYFSRMLLPPEAAKDRDNASERRGELERQADSLYPFLRSRLRSELVRDRERRGRLAREWR